MKIQISVSKMERRLSREDELDEINEFFAHLPPPDDLDTVKSQVKTFIANHQDRPIVLVTVSTHFPIDQIKLIISAVRWHSCTDRAEHCAVRGQFLGRHTGILVRRVT